MLFGAISTSVCPPPAGTFTGWDLWFVPFGALHMGAGPYLKFPEEMGSQEVYLGINLRDMPEYSKRVMKRKK